MTIFFIIALAASLALAVFLWAGRRQRAQLRSMEDFRARWQKVDIEAFANLVDPSEERFLREHLPPAEFRRLHRERLLAAREYLSRVGQNAQLMVQASHSGDAEDFERAVSQLRKALKLQGALEQE